jgi:hypothetical protein
VSAAREVTATPAKELRPHEMQEIEAYCANSIPGAMIPVRLLQRAAGHVKALEKINARANDRIVTLLAQNERLRQRAAELEPAADCWNALAKCYRMTFMGSAGCNPVDGARAGYAHITMNFWTAPPDFPDATRDQGQQDAMGRSQFGNFMDVALKNAALALSQPEKQS